MKKYISILVLAALCVLSCKKADVSGEEVIHSEKISGLEIRASLPSLTRSVLGDDGLTLTWTADDRIALWSVPMGTMDEFEATAGNLIAEYGFDPESDILGIITGVETLQRGLATGAMVSETLSVTEGVGTTSAKFHSEKPARSWFGNLSSLDDDMYWFGALYPASRTDLQFISWEQYFPKESFGGTKDYTIQHPFLKVNVPSVQDGKSYWNYQIVYDTGLQDVENRLARSIVTAGEMLSGAYSLEFSNWVVATSLLAFTLQASDAAQYAIKTLEITYESPKYSQGEYRNDYFALSGTVPVQFLNDEEYEVCIHSRFSTPYSWYVPQNDSSSAWSEMDEASPKLTLSFDSPVVLSGGQATSSDDLFYAVVIPTMDTQNSITYGNKPRIRFTAYDASGKEILGKVLQMGNTFNYKSRTVYPGIFKGTKYSFDLVLNPVTSPEAGNAGEYEEIVLN